MKEALSAIGNLVLAGSAMIGANEYVMPLAAISITLTVPTIIGGAAVCGAVLGAGYVVKNLISAKSKSSDQSQIIKEFKKIEFITDSKENDKKVLLLNTPDSELIIDELYTWTHDKNNEDKKIYLKKIQIENYEISQKSWNKLVGMRIFNTGVEELIIDGQRNIKDLTLALAKAARKKEFKSLKKLKLKDCAIDFMDLDHLSVMGKESLVKYLDLSNNRFHAIAPHPEKWYDFVNNMHKNYPYARKLFLNECGLENESIDRIIPLFNPLSVIRKLDLRKNDIYKPGYIKLFESDEFKSNLSIEEVKHDFPDSKRIAKAIGQHELAIQAFLNESGLRKEDNLPFEVIKGMVENNHKIINALDNHIERTITNTIAQKQVKETWRKNAEQCKIVKGDGELTHKLYLRSIRCQTVEKPSQMQVIAEEKSNVLKESINAQSFDIDINDNDGITLRYETIGQTLLAGFSAVQMNAQSPIIKNLSLSKLGLRDADFIELIEENVGSYQTSNLNLSQNNLSSEALKHWFEMPSNPFSRVKTLDLSDNHITIDALPALLKYCIQNKIEHLSLANNPLGKITRENMNSLAKLLGYFANLPSLKTLDISDIGIDEANSECLLPVLCQHSDLDVLNVSQTGFKISTIRKLVDRPEFISNIGLRNVSTGHNEKVSVSRVLKKRASLTQNFELTLSEEEKQRSTMFVILDRFLSNESDPNLPKELKEVLQKSSKSGELTKWDWYQDLAQRMLYRGLKSGFSMEEFSEFIENPPQKDEIVLSRHLSPIQSARDGERIQLRVNVQKIEIGKDTILKPLKKALKQLVNEDRKPIIDVVCLKHLSLNDREMDSILEKNVLGYEIEALDLSDNQLTDDSIINLLDYLKDAPGLRSLNLSNNKFSAKGILKLAEGCKEQGIQIETLILDGNALVPNVEDQGALSFFAQRAHYLMPNLKMLSLYNVLPNGDFLGLLTPLFSQPSLLREINIEQPAITRAPVYENFLKQPAVHGNVCIEKIETGKNKTKMIKSELLARNHLWKSRGDQLPSISENSGRICYLLDGYLNDDAKVCFSTQFNTWLNTVDKNVSGSLMASPGDKLKFMANEINYYRERARLLGITHIPDHVQEAEYLALKRNQLHQYWKTTQNKPSQSLELAEIQERFKSKIEQSTRYKALVLIQFKYQNMNCSVFWGQDDTVRLVNHETKKQFIIHRYAEALTLDINAVRSYVIAQNIELQFDDQGEIRLLANDNIEAIVRGGEATISKHAMTHTFNSEEFEMVSSIKELLSAGGRNVIANSPSQLTQFQRHRDGMPSIASQSNSNQSIDPPSIRLANLRT